MTNKPDHSSGAKAPINARDARLKAALKANLARRKQQARARADDTDQSKDKAQGESNG
ncbi:hypothetical protein [Celeribacter marinus]|uniref:hypothetical protein n=1 Tax=Celeribacter marinus TaxID=1397108 RepID=UPI003F6A71C7